MSDPQQPSPFVEAEPSVWQRFWRATFRLRALLRALLALALILLGMAFSDSYKFHVGLHPYAEIIRTGTAQVQECRRVEPNYLTQFFTKFQCPSSVRWDDTPGQQDQTTVIATHELTGQQLAVRRAAMDTCKSCPKEMTVPADHPNPGGWSRFWGGVLPFVVIGALIVYMIWQFGQALTGGKQRRKAEGTATPDPSSERRGSGLGSRRKRAKKRNPDGTRR